YSPNEWQALTDHLKKQGFSFEEMELANVVMKNKKGGYFDRFRNRAMFPIIDIRSNIIGFGGRILSKDGGAKYLNTSDTLVFNKSRNLFALNFAKDSKQDKFILAEGYMDVISLHQAGFTNSVATLGTALTAEQARLLSTYTDNIVISYDSDGAGQKASMRATGIFSEIGINTSVINMEGAKDPDEYIKKFGAKKFEAIVNKSKSVLEFEIDKIREKYNLEIPEEKMKFLNEFCFLMAGVRNPIERDVYIGKIITNTDKTKQAINERVEGIIKGKAYKQKRQERRDTKLYVGSTPNNSKDIERTKNIKYALAEDEIIKMLVLNPDYNRLFDNIISPEDFVTDDNRQIFSVIMSRIKEEKSIDISILSSQASENSENQQENVLNNKQISILTGLMAAASAKNYDTSEAKRLAEILLSKKKEKSAAEIKAMSDEEYKIYINSLKAKK
ncbi:MAG: toprim domain-containing protein, partial [Oscillospiraceae bacterium]